MSEVTVNKKYKDSIFRMLFSDKEELLSFYNAVNDTEYTDSSDLEINTLEDVVYVSKKNDISFVIDGRLSLYEHQSTWNGNMPLRNLLYVSNLFSKIMVKKGQPSLYGSKAIPLPNPQFITFYNGVEKKPDRMIQKLSQAYEVTTDEVNLELTVVVLNINHGHNEALMRKCPTLEEYAYYVKTVREHSKIYPIEEAVELAIEHCIKNNKLAEFLRNHRNEVIHMSIYEYDEEKHMATIREEGVEYGKEIGDISRTLSLMIKKVQKSKSLDVIADELECTPNEIIHLYETILQCGSECTVEEVLERLL